MVGFSYYGDWADSTKTMAYPEPRIIKQSILRKKEHCEEAYIRLMENRDVTSFREFQRTIFIYFMSVHVYQKYVEGETGDFFQSLHELKQRLKNLNVSVENSQKNILRWVDYKFDLDRLLYKSGITAIQLIASGRKFGYEFLNGLPFHMKEEDNGWLRLQTNLQNIRKLLRTDVDMMGLIWGGNRVGKSSLGLHIIDIINAGKVKPEHIIISDTDFWQFVDGDQYSGGLIDEMSDHFYSKNTMRKDQKLKKRKLKKYAVKNMFLVGCDLNIFNLDKEVLSDKLAFAIHVPRRGYFEFFSKEKIERFDKDKETGEAITPKPDFTGHFPKVPKALWELYKGKEKEKITIAEGIENRPENEDKDKPMTKKDIILYMHKQGNSIDDIARAVKTVKTYVYKVIHENKIITTTK